MNTSNPAAGRLAGKVAVITGGNSGIGLAIAERFCREGARVALFGRDAATLEIARGRLGGDTLAVQGDVRRIADLNRLFDTVAAKLGRVDVLVANAGIAKFAPIDDYPEDLFDEVCDINFKGAFFTVIRALPVLKDGASVILVGAADSDKQGRPLTGLYSATKSAVRALARGFSADLMYRCIRVNVLSPGMTETPIITRSGGLPGVTPEEIAAGITQLIPMRRRGRPEEMAHAALYLASDESAYCVGAELMLDGGLSQLAYQS
ncbi:MAG TPA: SDR family oxidoreductase [Burkholderiales bacterium]|nr:SDR family oxidoreductase [Burkholderiales bacterium]